MPEVLGGRLPNEPVRSLVPDPDGVGYWLVAEDGGVFAFEAAYRGSLPAVLNGRLPNAPVQGMVPYGDAYLMVATDGGIFNFATNLAFVGSLGADPPDAPVVAWPHCPADTGRGQRKSRERSANRPGSGVRNWAIRLTTPWWVSITPRTTSTGTERATRR